MFARCGVGWPVTSQRCPAEPRYDASVRTEEEKAQALADYVSAVGRVWIYGPNRVFARAGGSWEIESSLSSSTLLAEPRVPKPITIVVRDWTLMLIPASPISPRAVADRCEEARRLLSLIGRRQQLSPPFTPGTPPASGGSSPAPAEVRVWPRRLRDRCSS